MDEDRPPSIKPLAAGRVPLGLAVAARVLKEGWPYFNKETMADYDADIYPSESEPKGVFMNIWTHSDGQRYGFVIFHEFLERIGTGHRFITTAFTDSGQHLFEELERDGVIRRITQYETQSLAQNPSRMAYPFMYEVIADPREHLRAWVQRSQAGGLTVQDGRER